MIKLTSLIEDYKSKYVIYCDLDGVLCDFDQQFRNIANGIKPETFEDKYGAPRFWDTIAKHGIQYWENMPWTQDGRQLWAGIKNTKPIILTAIPHNKPGVSSKGKQNWCKKNLGQNVEVIVTTSKNKQLMANPNAILIDDRSKNIDQWIAKGGIGILHKNANSSIAALNKLK